MVIKYDSPIVRSGGLIVIVLPEAVEGTSRAMAISTVSKAPIFTYYTLHIAQHTLHTTYLAQGLHALTHAVEEHAPDLFVSLTTY